MTASTIQATAFATITRASQWRRLAPAASTGETDSVGRFRFVKPLARVSLGASTAIDRSLADEIMGKPRAKGLNELTQYAGAISVR